MRDGKEQIMHYNTDSPINEITICGKTLFEMDVGNGWSITDVWFDGTIPADKVDIIKIKLEKTEKDQVMNKGIESNKEAMAMMERALKSMQGKIREAYNKGYHDGLRDGIEQTTQKLVSRILEEVENETT